MCRPWIVWGSGDDITITDLRSGGVAPYGLTVRAGIARPVCGDALPALDNVHHRADERY